MKLLLAEDEKAMSAALVAVLEHSGYEVDAVYDGAAAVEQAQAQPYDCMIFDVMMPRMDGLEALRRIREAGDTAPVIMLTAKAEIEDRIHGLDTGADDYLTKPFAMGELLARLRSLARRADSLSPKRLRAGNVELNVEEQELKSRSAIRIGNKETKLMKYLMLNAGKTLSTEDIFFHIWKDEEKMEQDIVWVYVSYLREKLEAIGGNLSIEGPKNGPFVLKENCERR